MTPTAAELVRIPLFGSLSEPDLEHLAPSFESKSVSPGTRLVGEGAAGYSFFAIADGEASVTVDKPRSPRSVQATASARSRSSTAASGPQA